jgi:hypothetical protein
MARHNWFMAKFLLLIVLVLIGIWISKLPTPQTAQTTASEKAAPAPEPEDTYPMGVVFDGSGHDALEKTAITSGFVRSVAYSYEQGITIEGNLSFQKRVSYAAVTFTLYNGDGQAIGSVLTNVSGVGAGETWHFKAVTSENSAKTYRLANVVAY